MKQTKPAQAMELRSLSPVFGRLGLALPATETRAGLAGDHRRAGMQRLRSVDRALRLRGTSPAISAQRCSRRRATLLTRAPLGRPRPLGIRREQVSFSHGAAGQHKLPAVACCTSPLA
jgi:hypothetical protein